MVDRNEERPAEIVINGHPDSSDTDELDLLTGGKRGKYARLTTAALGSIPWVGGVISAAAVLASEEAQGRVNQFHRDWLNEHRERLNRLARALGEITSRLEQLGDEVEKRVNTEEYLNLVRQGFQVWNEAATDEKRKLVQQLLANSGSTKISSDDVVRLFIEWIEKYHEAHFAIIREVYKNPGATRGQIWDALYPSRPADNSPEADLYRLLIHDLSTGRVIRQHRPTNYQGQFLKKPKQKTRAQASNTMESAFEDTKPYELSALGSQFVHYTMNEVVKRIGG